MTDPNQTPARLGFRMPSERTPHRATWIAWPHERSDWPGKFTAIPWVYVEVVRHLTRDDGGGPYALPRERVCILVEDAAMERRARRLLARGAVDLGQVDFFHVPTDRSWVRDSGPIFVRRQGETAITNWRFNGWAKYPNHGKDDAVPGRLARALERREFVAAVDDGTGRPRRVVLEGGSIDVNGHGTLLTTEECLLSDVQARNPGLDRAALERILGEYLGVTRVIWLERGIVGDDTHGHVDDIARFVAPRTVVCAEEPDPSDPNHEPLRENRRILETATDQDGAALHVVPLPMPAPLYLDGVRLPASYANFYIGNRAVLVPTFNDPNDRIALQRLEAFFPERAVVPIHAVDLVWGLGTLHCMTQQEPA